MVNPEELAERGLRAYEVGRLLAALRVALVVMPIALLCLLERNGREACGCLSIVLLAAAVWLRWRDRRGTEAVKTGLLAGSMPLLAGLVLAHFDRCWLAGAESFCPPLSLLLGIGAGVLVSKREARWGARLSSFVTAAVIAGLAAGIGCVRLGAVGVASMLLGLGLGSALTAVLVGRQKS